jgi:hypothetical protein
MRVNAMKSFSLFALLAAVLAPCLTAQTPIFRAPVKVAWPVNDTTAFEGSPELSSDLLTIYFASDRSGGLGNKDIWMSTRSDLTSVWSMPVNVTALNSKEEEQMGALRTDGCEVILPSKRVQTWDLFVSTRTNMTQPWATPTLLAGIPTSRDQFGPSMTGDGLELYFCSNSPSTTREIFRTTRASLVSSWSTPVHVSELELSPGRPINEVGISSDGLEIIFSSNQGWQPTHSSYDFYYASRVNRTAKFGLPVFLSELGTYANEEQGRWTSDGFSFYFTVIELGDIFRADRILPICIPTGQPARGQLFEIACRRDPGDLAVILGSLFPMSPVRIPGTEGYLAIHPSFIVWPASGTVGKMGRFTTHVPIPSIAALKGLKIHWQVGAQDPWKKVFISSVVTTTIQ